MSHPLRLHAVSPGKDNLPMIGAGSALTEMKRTLQTLIDFLFRHQSFRHGVFLMTGTGIIPPDSFTLKTGDTISISIEGVGTLINTAA